MTVKEIEERLDISRANIRFYETEGLIHPSRKPNGYRDYSEEDIRTLELIRLLRALHVGLGEIRGIVSGEVSLSDALLAHMKHLEHEKEDMSACLEICRQICVDAPSRDSIDTGRYFHMLGPSKLAGSPELTEDAVEKVNAPFRRFFARLFDLNLYMLAWNAVISLIFHLDSSDPGVIRAVLSILFQIVSVVLAEPVLLSLTGTTPGKWILGLKVTAPSGGKLSYKSARERTWGVIRYGYGFFLPVYDLICQYHSYRTCRNSEYLPWEDRSVLLLKVSGKASAGRLRTACYIGCMTLVAAADFLIGQSAALPPYRGDITVEEFTENFNHAQSFYGVDHQLNLPETGLTNGGMPADSALFLKEDGTWEKVQGRSYMGAKPYAPLPELEFTEENGIMTGMEFSVSCSGEDLTVSSYGDLMALSAISFVCARDTYSLFSVLPERLYREITRNGDDFSGFSLSEAGIDISCCIEFSGYNITPVQYGTGDVLVPAYGETPEFHLTFTMGKEKSE